MPAEVSRKAAIIALHDMTHSSRVFKQADALSAVGCDATLVGIVNRSTDPRCEERDFGRIVRVQTTKNLHAERVQSTPTPAPRKAKTREGVLAGLRTFLGRMRENYLLAAAATEADPDVVIASDLTAWVAGYLTKRRTGAPLIIDVRDLVLDSVTVYPRVYQRLYGHVERFVVHRADALIVTSPLFGDFLSERYPRAPKAVGIYSGAFECIDEATPVHQPVRFFFQGAFAATRRLDEVITAMASVRDLPVTLTLQGFGAEEANLRSLVAELGLEDTVMFVPRCEPRDVVRCAAEYDVGVISHHGTAPNLRLAAPIKMLDYMAAGLAVLASDLPGLRQVLEREGCGVFFEPTGPESIARAIRELVGDPESITEMKKNSVRACPKYLASEQGKRFVEVVEGVLGKP